MSHPPVLAVVIAGALAIATLAGTYRTAQVPKTAIGHDTATATTPGHRLSHALQALRVDIQSNGIAPAM